MSMYDSLIFAGANGGEEGTKVEANPTLRGSEELLEGIKIDGTRYKVQKKLYEHLIHFRINSSSASISECYCKIISYDNTRFTLTTFEEFMKRNMPSYSENNSTQTYPCSGIDMYYYCIPIGVYYSTKDNKLRVRTMTFHSNALPTNQFLDITSFDGFYKIREI